MKRPKVFRKPSPGLAETLASNVKAFRKANGLSQEDFADLCGLHRTYVGAVERGERNVTLSTIEVLATALGVTVPELLAVKAPKK